ncbi:uncharacterized protein LOC114125837 [Aphis gossypii]|uniref:Uncharacterized protein n=1 Tax=Aphis gossypii TaxID=80765 RepID=A0A9P0IVL3_APHGO|nr:uncharacterized protein LOC114125837 [Aphis gossypii]CAH1720834.1 unnamed protein product [Aphis gossypii]
MDSAKLIDEIRSLNQKLDVMTEKLNSLDQKISNIATLQQTRDETMRKSANSITVIIRLLAGLRKLDSTALRTILVDSDALLHTIHPISTTDQNVDQIPITMDRVKSILKEAMDVVNSFPSAQQPSTSTSNDNDTEIKKLKKIEEADRVRIHRKYKNKYNYIDQIKPPLEDSVQEPESQNNPLENIPITNVTYSVQNDSNDDTQNDPNYTVQNDLNGPFTGRDMENNRNVYELLKSRLQNAPYDPSAFIINNVNATHFTVKWPNGEDCTHPLRAVQPLVLIKKCDALFSQFSDKLKKNKSNKSNNNKATTKMNKRETRANTTKDKTNSSISCVETTEKRSLETKNSEPSKKIKKN